MNYNCAVAEGRGNKMNDDKSGELAPFSSGNWDDFDARQKGLVEGNRDFWKDVDRWGRVASQHPEGGNNQQRVVSHFF